MRIGLLSYAVHHAHGLMRFGSHQQKALSMMVEKEAGTLEGAEFPSVWREETVGGADVMRYVAVSNFDEMDNIAN